MVDKIQDKVAFQVFDPVLPEFFQHLKIYIGKVEGFHFPVIDQAGVPGFSVVVTGKPFADAVGFFLAHADIDQPGLFERVLNLSPGKEDEVQSHNAGQGFYISRFKSLRFIEKDFDCFHKPILTTIELHFKTFLPAVFFITQFIIFLTSLIIPSKKSFSDSESPLFVNLSILFFSLSNLLRYFRSP